jgi:hypothetical protein
MFTNVGSDARTITSRVYMQFAGKKVPRHRQCMPLMNDVCMQAAQKQTHSSIPSPPSLSLSSPYSKNAGAEFVSKIDLATLQYSSVSRPTVHVRHRLHSSKQYNGKVPDIAMHTLVVYILEELCLSIIPPKYNSSPVHQMHTNVLLWLCHLGVSLRSITCKTIPTTYLLSSKFHNSSWSRDIIDDVAR